MIENTVLDLDKVKSYYNKLFTNDLLMSLQKEMKIEDLIFSYNYYSNLFNGNEISDKYEIEEDDYLKSDEGITNLNNYSSEKKNIYIKQKAYDSKEIINYFDPYITEEEFEDKIEKTFCDLNNILKSSYTKNEIEDSNKVDLDEVLQNLKVEKEQEYYKIFELRLEKNQICQITFIMIAFIIRSIFNLSLGRKLIFSNKHINDILLRALYNQNIYVQIFTLKHIKKYIIEDGESCDRIHLKMIKICIFSKSLCSFNRANELIQFLVKENKQVSEIFDFYFLKKLKISFEKSDNIQRLRLLDLISDNINLNNETVCCIFQVKKNGCNKENGNFSNREKLDSVNLSLIYENDQSLENFSFESDYENCTFDDISFMDQKCVKEIMNKYCLKLNEICKMTKINIYKYLHTLYVKDDILLKVNVLEIFSKLIKNMHYCDAVSENIHFLRNVLNDLKKPDEEILHLNILNSVISYPKINSIVLSFILNAHSNILMKTIINYLCDSCMNVEKSIVGIKSFGYFFSIKESCEILLKLDPNIHLTSIEKINVHSHINVLRHAINIWIRIIPSKSMDFVWFKDFIHNIFFERIITILKEIDDSLIQINIYNLLEIMINYDICDLILKQHWLIKSLQGNFENNSYELKMSRYNFFVSFYQINKTIISNNPYADNVINSFIERIPKRY